MKQVWFTRSIAGIVLLGSLCTSTTVWAKPVNKKPLSKSVIASCPVVGITLTKRYLLKSHALRNKVKPAFLVCFGTVNEAKNAGYQKAK